MLAINPELVCHLIKKAKAFHAREVTDIEEDSSNPIDDVIKDTLAINDEDEKDPIFDEIKSIIEDLDPDQKQELIAIMWIGRGDYHVDDWFAAIDDAKNLNLLTTEYLLSKPQIPEFLENGLNQLGYYCD